MAETDLEEMVERDPVAERAAAVASRLLTLLDEDGPGAVAIAASSIHMADLGGALTSLEPEARSHLFLALTAHIAGEVLEEMPPELRDELLADTSDERVVAILNEANADDAVYFLDHLDQERAEGLLRRLDQRLRSQLEEQFELPDDTAGHMMTRDVVILRPFMTAGQAVEAIRNRDRPYEGALFVVNADASLVGVIPLRKLVIAESRKPVGEVMDPDPISAKLDTDRTEVVDLMQRYHMRALPVVDGKGHLCGQITWDDALDAMEAEAEEDLLALAGTSEDPEDNPSIWRRASQRMPYLLVTTIGGFVMANIIERYTHSLAAFPILVGFLPLVPALGGNIGIQSATVTLRSIATGEFQKGSVVARTLREIGTGVVLAVCLSFISGIGAAVMIAVGGGQAALSIIITVSMLLAIVVAAGFGVFIPMMCNRIGIDPAIAAGPFITMLNDVTGVGIYLTTATILLAMMFGSAPV
jgi:magnesium transporter